MAEVIFKMNHAYIQNIWANVKISDKLGLVQKSLLSTFTSFLTAFAKVQVLLLRLGTGLPPTNFEDFLIFPNF